MYVDASATPDEILALFTLKWPRLSSPSLGELTASSDLADPAAPRTAEITAWSEFGHNVAGLFVLAMGVLAMLERTGRAPWARHWPLLIVALAGFVAYSVDPEGWETGAVGFWEHLMSPEVLQHRILLGLTVTLGLAEWRVRSGGHPASPWRWVFPVVTNVSGILLLTHVHVVSDLLVVPAGPVCSVQWSGLHRNRRQCVRHGARSQVRRGRATFSRAGV